MAYEKTNWVNNQTPLNEVNLNKLEQGVERRLMMTLVNTSLRLILFKDTVQ